MTESLLITFHIVSFRLRINSSSINTASCKQSAIKSATSGIVSVLYFGNVESESPVCGNLPSLGQVKKTVHTEAFLSVLNITDIRNRDAASFCQIQLAYAAFHSCLPDRASQLPISILELSFIPILSSTKR